MTGPQIRHGVQASKFVKSRQPDLPVVWGGIHASIVPEQTLENPYVDLVVVGEGEAAFPELIEAFQKAVSAADGDPSHNITIIRMSVSDRINEIIDILRSKRQLSFSELLEGQQTRSDLVVTFISLLEMAKMGLTRIHQAAVQGEIYIKATGKIDETLGNLEENFEEGK